MGGSVCAFVRVHMWSSGVCVCVCVWCRYVCARARMCVCCVCTPNNHTFLCENCQPTVSGNTLSFPFSVSIPLSIACQNCSCERVCVCVCVRVCVRCVCAQVCVGRHVPVVLLVGGRFVMCARTHNNHTSTQRALQYTPGRIHHTHTFVGGFTRNSQSADGYSTAQRTAQHSTAQDSNTAQAQHSTTKQSTSQHNTA